VLVLVSFALVLLATVLLVLGLLNDELTLIYLSIACSAGAAIVLIVALRRHPRETAPPAAGPPAPETGAPSAE
jgi:hypothetical protein